MKQLKYWWLGAVIAIPAFAYSTIWSENFSSEPASVLGFAANASYGELTFNEEVATSTNSANVWTRPNTTQVEMTAGYAQLEFNGSAVGRVLAVSLDESLFGGVAGTYTVGYDFLAEGVAGNALGLKIMSATADSLYDLNDGVNDLLTQAPMVVQPDATYATVAHTLVGTGAYSTLAAQTVNAVGNGQSLDFVYDGSSEIVLMFYSIINTDKGNAAANGYVQIDNIVVTTDPVDPPVIDSFTADSPVIIGGESAQLSWSVSGIPSDVSISPAVGSGLVASGSTSVTPAADTLYTLIATNDFGAATQTVSVAVIDIDFSATPSVVTNAGDSVLLSWGVSGADSVSIDQGIGAVSFSNSTSVSIVTNITYTLTATRPEGNASKSVNVFFETGPMPNILFIAVDDLKQIGGFHKDTPDYFLNKVYPDPVVRDQVISNLTPNIDQLAAEGVSFMRAYCASPACNPSRTALLTGIRPHRSGMVNNFNGNFFRDWLFGGTYPFADATTLPEYLKASGYYTAGVGKVFHDNGGFNGNDGSRSWTNWKVVSGDAGATVQAPLSPPEWRWGQEGGNAANYTNLNDYRRADFISTMLEGTNPDFTLPTNKPFFLACGIYRPHRPHWVTKDLLDLFPEEQMTGVNQALLDEFAADCDDLPPTGLTYSGGDGSDTFVTINNFGGIPAWKDLLQHYLASTAIADRSVGRLLSALNSSPYASNTIVILWSDHGWHLGEKMRMKKFALWEEATGCNLIFSDPLYSESAGVKSYRPVNLIDIYPTICARLGLPLPDSRITGHNLAPLLENPQAPWNIPSLCTQDLTNRNMIATDRFKLITYDGGTNDAEFYDRDADPGEYDNLINDPAYAAEQAEMFSLLTTALEEGTFPDEQQWSIESWRHGYWGRSTPEGDTTNSADWDSDGWDNFTEFAFLGNPLEASPELSNAVSFTIEGGEAVLRFPFRDAPASIEYDVDQSTNLVVGWSNVWNSATNSVPVVTEADYGNGTRSLRVGTPSDEPEKFMRLNLISQPSE